MQIIRFDWRGIAVSVGFCPDWSMAFRSIYGRPLAHLGICREGGGPLPITETGSRSHFTSMAEIEDRGGPEAFVRAWLDAAAGQPEWKKRQEQWRQPSLFA